MTYDVEFTDEFRDWFEVDLSLSEQESVTRVVDMLQDAGPLLRFPY